MPFLASSSDASHKRTRRSPPSPRPARCLRPSALRRARRSLDVMGAEYNEAVSTSRRWLVALMFAHVLRDALAGRAGARAVTAGEALGGRGAVARRAARAPGRRSGAQAPRAAPRLRRRPRRSEGPGGRASRARSVGRPVTRDRARTRLRARAQVRRGARGLRPGRGRCAAVARGAARRRDALRAVGRAPRKRARASRKPFVAGPTTPRRSTRSASCAFTLNDLEGAEEGLRGRHPRRPDARREHPRSRHRGCRERRRSGSARGLRRARQEASRVRVGRARARLGPREARQESRGAGRARRAEALGAPKANIDKQRAFIDAASRLAADSADLGYCAPMTWQTKTLPAGRAHGHPEPISGAPLQRGRAHARRCRRADARSAQAPAHRALRVPEGVDGGGGGHPHDDGARGAGHRHRRGVRARARGRARARRRCAPRPKRSARPARPR